MDFDYLFWHNPAKANAAGLAPVSLRLTLGGQRTEISTKLRCTAAEWDTVTHRLHRTGRHKHAAAKDYNQALDLIEGKVVLLRASLPATTTLAALRAALRPAPAPKALPTPAPAPCLLAALEAARLAHANQFTQATYLTALNKLRAYVAPAEALPLPAFTAEAAAHYAAWLREQAGPQANAYLLNLNALWQRAFPKLASPLAGLFSQARRKRLKPRYVLSADELARLAALELFHTRAGIARDVYLTQYYLHGSRVGVVLELTWQQVDWPRGRVLLRAEKGGDWQRIALRQQLATVLRRYWPGPGAAGLVFPLLPATYHDLAPLPRYRARKAAALTVWKGLQSCARLLDLPGQLHSHTARHTLATHTVQRTKDYRLAQQLLGHSTLAMTEQYIRPMLADELDAGADEVYGG